MEDLRYPVGQFHYEPLSEAQRIKLIDQITEAPDRLRSSVDGLSATQIETPYRPGGWTVRQVVHHVPESHMNAYIRFKLALTEEQPIIKPYQEARWAELEDIHMAPLELSLSLLEALHRRWTLLLGVLKEQDWARTFKHPELGVVSLDKSLALYAWHGRHHVAHITSLRERMGWR